MAKKLKKDKNKYENSQAIVIIEDIGDSEGDNEYDRPRPSSPLPHDILEYFYKFASLFPLAGHVYGSKKLAHERHFS